MINAIPRSVDARVDLFGNTVVTLHIPRVEEEVTFITSSVVERDARHGPHLEPAAMLEDRRLLDASPLTGADHPIDRLAEELRASGLTGGALATAANEAVHNALRTSMAPPRCTPPLPRRSLVAPASVRTTPTCSLR